MILKPGYAPEEQYRSRGEQGPWSDVYGLAATLYRCLVGQAPPDALDRLHEDTLVPPSRLGIPLPPSLEAALLRGLAVRAPDRYPGVEPFRTALREGERRRGPRSQGAATALGGPGGAGGGGSDGGGGASPVPRCPRGSGGFRHPHGRSGPVRLPDPGPFSPSGPSPPPRRTRWSGPRTSGPPGTRRGPWGP